MTTQGIVGLYGRLAFTVSRKGAIVVVLRLGHGVSSEQRRWTTCPGLSRHVTSQRLQCQRRLMGSLSDLLGAHPTLAVLRCFRPHPHSSTVCSMYITRSELPTDHRCAMPRKNKMRPVTEKCPLHIEMVFLTIGIANHV
jgi:hypothetical protein